MVEPSIAWFEACDSALAQLRARAVGLAQNTSLYFHPSVEAALVEWALILLDRNRETGAGKSNALIQETDDPCLRFASQVVSAQGLATAALATGVPASGQVLSKAEALFVAVCDDDRFEAFERIEGGDPARSSALADPKLARTPMIRLRSYAPRDFGPLKPQPYDIRLQRLDDGTAVSILGERLRFLPRFAMHAFSREGLRASEQSFQDLLASVQGAAAAAAGDGTAPDVNSIAAELKAELEATQVPSVASFGASFGGAEIGVLVPPRGTQRVGDRLILVSESHDSFWLAEKLGLGADLVPLSGCFNRDERLQEWLRRRTAPQYSLTTPLQIRGALQVRVDCLLRVGIKAFAGAVAAVFAESDHTQRR